jgi:hypothetical protein
LPHLRQVAFRDCLLDRRSIGNNGDPFLFGHKLLVLFAGLSDSVARFDD